MSPAERLASIRPNRPRKIGLSPVAEARLRLGLTLSEVARHFGLSVATVHSLENGANPRTATALRFARFYGRTVEELFGHLLPITPEET